MKKIVMTFIFSFALVVSAMAMSPRPGHNNPGHNNPGHNNPGNHGGGGGTPEPISMLLILGGLGVAYGAKKIIKK